MIRKNKFILGMFALILISIISFSSATEQLYCCERTTAGAWCQSAPSSSCNSNFLSSPTSCNLTSFCQTGTCIDNTEGICLPNTPQKVCENEGGFWSDKPVSELAQCSYGCCFYGDQSAFTTQTRCGTLASMFGLNSTYRADITDEVQCIAAAGLQEKGACVFVQSGTRNCRMLTKGECNSLKGNKENENVEFNEGYLCTAGFLDTVCKPLGGTTCVSGKSEVYFKDTCGNIANIYDSQNTDLRNLKNSDYWTRVYEKEESCGWEDETGNANSKSCGNCEYLLGSICKEYDKNEDAKPNYGNYVCGDLSCDYDVNENGKIDSNEEGIYKHGEKWCASNNNQSIIRGYTSLLVDKKEVGMGITIVNNISLKKGNIAKDKLVTETVAGTEQYVMKCYNGEVLVESCTTGEWRNKICVSAETNGISNAKCVANVWQDCLEQKDKSDCLDTESRDCKWVEGYSLLKDEDGHALGKDENGKIGTCVPKSSPANNFWDSTGDAGELCGIMTDITVVEYKFPTTKDRKKMDGDNLQDREERDGYCEENCEALNTDPDFEKWLKPRMEICASLGDCTSSTNYIGEYGEDEPLDLIIYKFFRKAKDVSDEDIEGVLNE